MIRHPLGLRLDPDRPVRDQIHEAARLGARGVLVEAIGDVAPHRLGDTGRRELRHILRSVELSLVGLALPTRRPFDTIDQLDERMRRADAAFAMAYELGTSIVVARAGTVPPSEDIARLEVFTNTLRELGRRAEHHGIKLAIETGADPGAKLNSFLDSLGSAGLAVSIDPASILQAGIDPIVTVRELATWVVHAYAKDATGSPGVPAVNPRGFGFPPGSLDWE
jgi:sugar phosphate isomerase/epimerase